MIVIKLKGGLGNQMFQYAFGRSLVELYRTELYLDLTWFEQDFKIDTPRKYILNKFNIKENIFSQDSLDSFKKERFIDTFLPYYKRKIVVQNNNLFDKRLFSMGDNKYVDGYWQSEKYFKDIEQIIREEFVLKNEYNNQDIEMFEKIKSSESVAVHFRHGDYVYKESAFKHHGICSLDYYYEAINLIKKHVSNPSFYIFSDDIEWVKKNFLLNHDKLVFVSEKKLNDYQEMFAMSLCKHFIIANSSFSWWGAWLSMNQGKKVVCPKKWFVNDEKNKNNIILDDWYKI